MLGQAHQIVALAKEDFRRLRREKVRAAALYAVAGVFALTAYICIVTALVLWVARHTSPVAATVLAALGFAVLTLFLVVTVSMMNRAERRRRQRRADAYAALLRSAAGTAMLGALIRPKPLAAAAAVLVAGLAFGLFRGAAPGAASGAAAGAAPAPAGWRRWRRPSR